MLKFTITYSTKTFDDVISAGVLTCEADDIETVKETAYSLIARNLSENSDEDEDWRTNLQNINISVTVS